MVLRLLPILDDLQRAVANLPEDAPPSWSGGVHLILRKLQGLLDSEGVTAFSVAPGTPFNPSEHEAVYFERSGQQPEGSVVSTVHPGYRGMGRVLRPAQVVLAQPQEEQRS